MRGVGESEPQSQRAREGQTLRPWWATELPRSCSSHATRNTLVASAFLCTSTLTAPTATSMTRPLAKRFVRCFSVLVVLAWCQRATAAGLFFRLQQKYPEMLDKMGLGASVDDFFLAVCVPCSVGVMAMACLVAWLWGWACLQATTLTALRSTRSPLRDTYYVCQRVEVA